MIEIIAEAGVNHDGDVNAAIELVDVAWRAGADAIKFQTFVPELVASLPAKVAPYQARMGGPSTQVDLIRPFVLSPVDTLKIVAHCRSRGIEFMSTPSDVVSLKFLVERCDVRRIKIGSGDLTNLPLLRAAAACNLPIILSTGMSERGDVDVALEAMQFPLDLTLLHCVSLYPTPIREARLSRIKSLGAHGRPVGFSDHTLGHQAAMMAVALGATMIEKHITLSNLRIGPDHLMSADPTEFDLFVRMVKTAEKALRDGNEMSADEREVSMCCRKSIVAAHPIMIGKTFTEDDFAIKRPGTGLPPRFMPALIGMKAHRMYDRDDLIELPS